MTVYYFVKNSAISGLIFVYNYPMFFCIIGHLIKQLDINYNMSIIFYRKSKM